MTVLVLTLIPSPYQVELFNALAAVSDVDLTVGYVQHRLPERQWKDQTLRHTACFLSEKEGRACVEGLAKTADVVVFSGYQQAFIRRLIKSRAARNQPWAFWGERPGFRGLGALGRLYRRVRLHTLHQSTAPIWGIGQWAVEAYQREFGPERSYYNIPYFSDLQRFSQASRRERDGQDAKALTILYSGSLIKRKGVDLLAQAFEELVHQVPQNLQLDIVGDGPLRGFMEDALSGARDRVHFHGFQSWEALPRLYARGDILCAPSRYDGWGMIIPEGLAAGLPVIATDRMGAAIDLITPGRNGWIAAADNLDSLTDTISQALEEYSKRPMAKRARASVGSLQLPEGVERFLMACRKTIAQW